MSTSTAPSPFRADAQPTERYQPERYPPFVALPGLTRRALAETPNVGYFTVPAPGEKVVKSYRIRVRRPKFPWLPFLTLLLPTVGVGSLLLTIGFFLFRKRGHTLLYLTNQRVIVVDLGRGLFRRYQSVMSYDLRHIAGFTLYAQRGLKKLLHLILLKEKRTFYLRFVTPHFSWYDLGAVNTRGSEFDPGMDAVTLCAELDALVLGLKAGMPPK